MQERMIAEKESLTQQRGFGSSTPVNESQILSKELGEHRDHKTGRGCKLKGDTSSFMFDESEYTTPAQRSFTDDQVRDMISNFNAFVTHSNATHMALVQSIRNISLNVQVPDIPTFSYTMPVVPPPPSPSQQNTDDDNNEDLGDD